MLLIIESIRVKKIILQSAFLIAEITSIKDTLENKKMNIPTVTAKAKLNLRYFLIITISAAFL